MRGTTIRACAVIVIGMMLASLVPVSFGSAINISVTGYFAGGSGTIADPYIITNVWELQNMSLDLGAHYALGNDIDASATQSWNTGAGFSSIGTILNPFLGEFNGCGYTIFGMYINRSTATNIGLFGYAGINSSISNISLDQVTISGKEYVGGIAGQFRGSIVNNAVIKGQIIGKARWTGGLIGLNAGLIAHSYSSGIVNVTVQTVGGLVGDNQGNILNSYSTADVSGSLRAGGLVGRHSLGTISYCYSTGLVTGTSECGGLVGIGGSNSTTCFWDIETSGMLTSSGGTGKTTAEMKMQATFAGWDFANIWHMRESVTYPQFQWQELPHIDSGLPVPQNYSIDFNNPISNFQTSGDTIYGFDTVDANGNGFAASPEWTADPDICGWVRSDSAGIAAYSQQYFSGKHIYSTRSINKDGKAYSVAMSNSHLTPASGVTIYQHNHGTNSISELFTYNDPQYVNTRMQDIDLFDDGILVSGYAFNSTGTENLPQRRGAIYFLNYTGIPIWRIILNGIPINSYSYSSAVRYDDFILATEEYYNTSNAVMNVRIHRITTTGNHVIAFDSANSFGGHVNVRSFIMRDLDDVRSTVGIAKIGTPDIYIWDPLKSQHIEFKVDSNITGVNGHASRHGSYYGFLYKNGLNVYFSNFAGVEQHIFTASAEGGGGSIGISDSYLFTGFHKQWGSGQVITYPLTLWMPVHNLDTGEYFDTIQSAIDDPDTLGGHTIVVSPGTYFEQITLHKQIDLVGMDKETTEIDSGSLTCLYISNMQYCNITGFSMVGGSIFHPKVEVFNSSYCGLFDLMVNTTSGGYGIEISQSNNISVIGCTIGLCNYGLVISNSENVNANHNAISDSGTGIDVYGSEIKFYNHVIDSTNTVDGKQVIYMYDQHNIFLSAVEAGHITLAGCTNIDLSSIVFDVGDGCRICYSDSCLIYNCTFLNNVQLDVYQSSRIIVERCLITGSGIGYDFSSECQIISNNFTNFNALTIATISQ